MVLKDYSTFFHKPVWLRIGLLLPPRPIILNGIVEQGISIWYTNSFSSLGNLKYCNVSKLLGKLFLFKWGCPTKYNGKPRQPGVLTVMGPIVLPPEEQDNVLPSAMGCSPSPQQFEAQELSVFLYSHGLPQPDERADVTLGGLDREHGAEFNCRHPSRAGRTVHGNVCFTAKMANVGNVSVKSLLGISHGIPYHVLFPSWGTGFWKATPLPVTSSQASTRSKIPPLLEHTHGSISFLCHG